MGPRIVMDVGGWSPYQAIEPYLNSPVENVVDEALSTTVFVYAGLPEPVGIRDDQGTASRSKRYQESSYDATTPRKAVRSS